MAKLSINIFWHRRDLRIHDNAGLSKALKDTKPVLPVFVFDKTILELLPSKDARVQFIHDYLNEVHQAYAQYGSSIRVFHGDPKSMFETLMEEYDIHRVFTNRDYEPYAQKRDKEISHLLSSNNIEFIGAKDHVIFEKSEVVKDDGKPYTVFTPYSRKWKAALKEDSFQPYSMKYGQLFQCEPFSIMDLKSLGF
ncbi:MAG: deoxyribodipyrimidine photo-lyase, partial [Bacteroidota bacterium]